MSRATDTMNPFAEQNRARVARFLADEEARKRRGDELLDRLLAAKVREVPSVRERVRSWVQDFCI